MSFLFNHMETRLNSSIQNLIKKCSASSQFSRTFPINISLSPTYISILKREASDWNWNFISKNKTPLSWEGVPLIKKKAKALSVFFFAQTHQPHWPMTNLITVLFAGNNLPKWNNVFKQLFGSDISNRAAFPQAWNRDSVFSFIEPSHSWGEILLMWSSWFFPPPTLARLWLFVKLNLNVNSFSACVCSITQLPPSSCLHLI